MRTIVTICRELGHPPSWWDTLDSGDQALLLADLRLRAGERAAASEAWRGRRRG